MKYKQCKQRKQIYCDVLFFHLSQMYINHEAFILFTLFITCFISLCIDFYDRDLIIIKHSLCFISALMNYIDSINKLKL